jgi:transposase
LSRRTLSAAQWARIEGLVAGKKRDRGRTGADTRLFVEAVLWRARGCAPWRDLPGDLGNWTTVYSRFRRWRRRGVWERLFSAVSEAADFECVLIEATLSKTHPHATGAKGAQAHGIGRSKGGLTTRIQAGVDARGNPPRFEISGGRSMTASSPRRGSAGRRRPGRERRLCLRRRAHPRLHRGALAAEAVIPSTPSRAGAMPMDAHLYKERHLIECVFNTINRFRRISPRCEKTLSFFRAFVHLACAMNWLR